MTRYDVAVVGGGINGCGIARDAAGRGHSVLLVDKGDLGGATSSASTKLIHGGLRYLEHWEFRLVREALAEREVLLSAAPHLVRPLRFVLPHHAGLRPAWMLRVGLMLYDTLGGRRSLPATRTLDLANDPIGGPLRDEFVTGFEYSDCWVDDSRLVIVNAVDAAARGASVRPRCECVAASRHGDGWRLELRDAETGAVDAVACRVLVNATGPWAGRFAEDATGRREAARVRLVQGSHIVVRKLFDHDRAYIFQNSDGRVVFAIPFEDDFMLIGTTERDYVGDPAGARITTEEADYLCAAVGGYLRMPVRPDDIVWSFSGVRPLYDDGTPAAQAATRDYVLSLDGGEQAQAPMLNVFGGKLTTYRRLAEAALDRLAPHLPGGRRRAWTRGAALPGGDFRVGAPADLVDAFAGMYPGVDRGRLRRLASTYGTRVPMVLGPAGSDPGLRRRFGVGPCAAEVDYLVEHEWARTAEDIVWRRTKLGLRMSESDIAAIDSYIQGRGASARRARADRDG